MNIIQNVSLSCAQEISQLLADDGSLGFRLRLCVGRRPAGTASPTLAQRRCPRRPFFRLSSVDVGDELGEGKEEYFCLGEGAIQLDSHAQLVAVLFGSG